MMDVIVFLAAVALTAVLLFSMVFFVIMFSDLESDYINPIDMCAKLNVVRSMLPSLVCLARVHVPLVPHLSAADHTPHHATTPQLAPCRLPRVSSLQQEALV